MNEVVLVIPGLGDKKSHKLIKISTLLWRRKNRSIIIFHSNWESNETYTEKLQRLEEIINKLNSKRIIVVANSAGGALAAKVASNHKAINKTILISSKLKDFAAIGQTYHNRAPALVEAVKASEESLTQINLNTCYCLLPLFDNVVPKKDMYINGMHKITLPTFGHSFSIGFALLFVVPLLINRKI